MTTMQWPLFKILIYMYVSVKNVEEILCVMSKSLLHSKIVGLIQYVVITMGLKVNV